jgi:hypothetical protein
MIAGPAFGAPTDDTVRAAIQFAYDKEAEAASLKYVNGMLSVRTRDFQAFSYGNQMDLRDERAQLMGLMSSAMSASESTRILGLHRVDANHASCRIHQEITVVSLERVTGTPMAVTVETESQDEWLNTPRGWRETECHMSRQIITRRPTSIH